LFLIFLYLPASTHLFCLFHCSATIPPFIFMFHFVHLQCGSAFVGGGGVRVNEISSNSGGENGGAAAARSDSRQAASAWHKQWRRRDVAMAINNNKQRRQA
jgi:hypothetical protein